MIPDVIPLTMVGRSSKNVVSSKREQQDADYDKYVQRMKELLEQFASLLPQAAADGGRVVKQRKQLRQQWRDIPKVPARLSGPFKV